MKNKLTKTLSIVVIVVVIVVMTLIPTFAAIYNPIVPITFSNYGSFLNAVAFPGAHAVPLYVDGTTVNDYLDSDDYNNQEGTHILYGDLFNNGLIVPYIQVYLETNYATIYFNETAYNGSRTAPGVIGEALVGVTSISSYPVASSYTAGVTYHYTFNIVLGQYFDYDAVYKEAYDKGKEDGFDEGYVKGINATESEALGHNLLGRTFSAPFEALNQFVLYESSDGLYTLTLGSIVGGVIAFSLFIAFLKLFAGG